MEQRIVKNGIYGLIVGLLIGVIIFKDYKVEHHPGGWSTTYEPLRMYILKLIRFSAIVSIIAMLMTWIMSSIKLTKEKTSIGELVKGYVISTVIGFIVITISVLIIQAL